MYHHFVSKHDLADAILETAADIYTAIADHWTTVDAPPLDAIAGLVDDAATAFTAEPAMRAEVRLSLDDEFRDRHPLQAWNAALLLLASAAAEQGSLRDGFDAEKFVRVLSVSLTGHRLLAHITPDEIDGSIRSGYTETLAMVLTAATTADSDIHTQTGTDGLVGARPGRTDAGTSTPRPPRTRRGTPNARTAQV